MPITSRSEFEAVLGQIGIKIDKALYERGCNPVLEEARRTVDQLAQSSKDGPKLKTLRTKLDATTDALSALLDDSQLRDELWDCLDYVDYRA